MDRSFRALSTGVDIICCVLAINGLRFNMPSLTCGPRSNGHAHIHVDVDGCRHKADAWLFSLALVQVCVKVDGKELATQSVLAPGGKDHVFNYKNLFEWCVQLWLWTMCDMLTPLQLHESRSSCFTTATCIFDSSIRCA